RVMGLAFDPVDEGRAAGRAAHVGLVTVIVRQHVAMDVVGVHEREIQPPAGPGTRLRVGGRQEEEAAGEQRRAAAASGDGSESVESTALHGQFPFFACFPSYSYSCSCFRRERTQYEYEQAGSTDPAQVRLAGELLPALLEMF